MLDPNFEAEAARRPHVGLCPVGVPDVPAPPPGPGLGAGYRTLQGDADALLRALNSGEVQGLLILAPGRTDGAFQLQLRAENRTPEGQRLQPVGPSVARATVPVPELVRALLDRQEPAEVVSAVAPDGAGALFYGVLAGLDDHRDTPPVGLLRVPADASPERVAAAAAACAQAMGRRLGPLPRQA